jgi:hypothetical protein
MSSARPKLTGALANLMNPKPGQGIGQGAEPPAASPPPANDPALAAAGQPPEAEKPTTIGGFEEEAQAGPGPGPHE